MDDKTMGVCDALADLILSMRVAKIDGQYTHEIMKAREALERAGYREAKNAQHEKKR